MNESSDSTREPQYNASLKVRDEIGFARMGIMTNQAWHDDPKHVLFTLARYKFVSKMLEGYDSVLEVGCGDAFGTRLVADTVNRVVATDFDEVMLADCRDREDPKFKIEHRAFNALEGPFSEPFQAAYLLDVLEHIEPEQEDLFLGNIAASVEDDGVVIVGMPSLESQEYASSQSKIGHINCKTGAQLKTTMVKHFRNVFHFSMNDEVVHTGFAPMAHYRFALGVCPVRS